MTSLNKAELPKPGLRNIKTALSVFFCILLFQVIDRPNPLFACSAAIICMRETVHYSYKKGIDRLIGTLLGGFVGLLFLLIKNQIGFLNIDAVIAGVGVFIVIYLCNLFNKSSVSVISSIVVLAIVIGAGSKSPFLYAFGRTLDTLIGVIVALLVNRYVYPQKEEV